MLNWFATNSGLVLALTAVLALFFSVLSIYLTYRSFKLQRFHEENSIRPVARFYLSDYENIVGVRLKNCGIGPMVIDQLAVTQDGQVSSTVVECMPPLLPGDAWYTFEEDTRGFAVLPGEELNLLEYRLDDRQVEKAHFRDTVRLALSKLTLSVGYSDIYGRPMPPWHRELAFFGRHFIQTE